jgi:protein O-GlcNAc transferase
MDGPLMRAAFPFASIEKSDYWQDLLDLNVTVVFDRVMLVNRHTAHRQ